MRALPDILRTGALASLAAAALLCACARDADREAASSSTAAKAPSTASASRAIISDDALAEKIDALFAAEFKRFDITIAVEKGEVTLGGFALNKKQAERALEIARAAEGAIKVNDQISLYPLGYILQ